MYQSLKEKISAPQRYQWTQHSKEKMQYYNLSESFVKRVVRYPTRTEQGIAGHGTVAVMKPPQTKKYSEVWVLYVPVDKSYIRIISAWRYPGKSPKRNPVPQHILDEARQVFGRLMYG